MIKYLSPMKGTCHLLPRVFQKLPFCMLPLLILRLLQLLPQLHDQEFRNSPSDSAFSDCKGHFRVDFFLGWKSSSFLPMSYYSVLGVRSDSSSEEIRRAYRMLAMRWHPDRWVRTPSFYDEAKQKFQQILEAYSVLSDQRKRAIYDAGLYDSRDEEDEGFCEFMQEMVSLMAQVRRESANYNLEEEFQKLLAEMGKSLDSPSSNWYHQSEPMFGHSKPSKRTRFEPAQVGSDGRRRRRRRGSSHLNLSGSGMCGSSVYCN